MRRGVTIFEGVALLSRPGLRVRPELDSPLVDRTFSIGDILEQIGAPVVLPTGVERIPVALPLAGKVYVGPPLGADEPLASSLETRAEYLEEKEDIHRLHHRMKKVDHIHQSSAKATGALLTP